MYGNQSSDIKNKKTAKLVHLSDEQQHFYNNYLSQLLDFLRLSSRLYETAFVPRWARRQSRGQPGPSASCLPFQKPPGGGKGARGALRLEDTSDSSLAAFFLSRWWRVVVVSYNNHSHFDSNLSLVGNEKAGWTVTSIITRQKSSKLLFQSSTYRALWCHWYLSQITQNCGFFDFWTKTIFKQIWNKPLKHQVIVRSSLAILPPYWTLKMRLTKAKLRREY